MKLILCLALALCLAIAGLELMPQGRGMVAAATAPVDAAVQASLGYFDKRPVRHILIIGNSRTYYHQMPQMVGRMAEAARSPVRLAIAVQAWGGASFEENWNSPEVQRLLKQHWDLVILQPESRANTSDDTSRSFATYGEKLIMAARETGSPVALIINWGYGESLYTGDPPEMRQAYIDAIETATRELASNAGAQVIDTSKVWEQVHAAAPALALYEDGNHPTVYGSYLSALMIYGFIYGADVAAAPYPPDGMDPAQAQLIRGAVGRFYGNAAQGA
jgi:hypothetical protein